MIIYKITNKLTDESYIGYTKQELDIRWKQHYTQALKESKNRKFYNAIRKYGIDAWHIEVIDTADTAQEAKEKEIRYIEQFNTYSQGYNSTHGGDGNNGIVMSYESNLARSQKLKGRKKSPETVEKFKQRRQSSETKQKISAGHTGMKKPWVKWTPDQCRARGLTRRSLTKQQYELIHNLRNKGNKIKAIAEEVSLSIDIVKKWLKMSW